MGSIMYRTENLNKSYADGDGVCYALKDVNLDISKGQMVAIVGESGSGKSTLLNILGAIDSATDGKVIANGKNIAGLSEEQLSTYRSKTVGFVFQAFHIIDCYTVYDNIELPLIINKVPRSQRDDEFVILDGTIASETYGIGFKLGNTELRDAVQKTLDEMAADGTFAKIAEKWGLSEAVCLGK